MPRKPQLYCDQPNCTVSYNSPAALGRHKWFAHKIPGRTHHKEVHVDQAPRAIVPVQAYPPAASPETNGLREIPEGALAVAFGAFKEFCIRFATEYDLPPQLFTARLSEFAYHASVRQPDRRAHRL